MGGAPHAGKMVERYFGECVVGPEPEFQGLANLADISFNRIAC